MSFNSRIGALTDELVQSITNFSPEKNARAFRHAKDLALRSLKSHHYGRTNQFDVQASLEGLDEKFRVLDRDDLAGALKERLAELKKKSNKFTPEVLSLLLHLSDKPVENTRLEALKGIEPPESPVPLTWKEIIAEDPPTDEELWENIDYGTDSSEDERELKRQEKSPKSQARQVSSDEHDNSFNPESCIEPVDSEALAEIEASQIWRASVSEDTGRANITELQAVRETLFMLAGIQTSLYAIDLQSGNIRPVQKYAFSHAIPSTLHSLLSQLADIGRDLYRLRQWASRQSSFPLIQTFEDVVTRRVADYDRYLASLQQRYLVPASPISVSLVQVHDEVRRSSAPLRHLASLVRDIEPILYINPFAHLEALFDRIELAQMSLEAEVFKFMGDIFFECLQTYLKPIRRWMEFGELGPNDETFFVFENDSSSEVSSLWHDRFVLRRGQENALRSPKFLQPAAQKIFNSGKSVIFLKELGIRDPGESTEPEPSLDFNTVCGTGEDVPLQPFSELFAAAFEVWIKSKYSLASTVLRSRLLHECGLLGILNVFKHLFLSANGSVFQDFAGAIFERMDTQRRGWNDRYLLTELAHAIYGTVLDPEDADKIMVRATSTKETRSVKGLSSVTVDYVLPWSIMNIIQRSSIPIYQQVFTFLLQTYRAKYLLQNIDWKDISSIKGHNLTHLSYKLRQRLIWFADTIRSYLAETVFALSTEDMTSQLLEAQDIDEMSSIHMKYVARLQEQSLLTPNLKPIHQAIVQILDLAVLFADIHSSHARQQPAQVPTKTTAPLKENVRPRLCSKKSRKSIIPTIVENVSSGSEQDDAPDTPSTNTTAKPHIKFSENLFRVRDQFDRLLPFVIAGLRGVSRAGGEECWEMLAENLEWEKTKERERFEV